MNIDWERYKTDKDYRAEVLSLMSKQQTTAKGSYIKDTNMDAPEITTQVGQTPEERYRTSEENSSSPASPYNAAKGWILGNYSLIPMAMGATMAPVTTAAFTLGNTAGQITGNTLSDYMYSNPDKEYSINVDTSITPRQINQHLLGLLFGTTSSRFANWGMTDKVISGTENRVVTKPFSRYVYKESTIPLEEVQQLNESPTFLPYKYLGQTEGGLSLLRQPKALLVAPKFGMKFIARNMAKRGYYPTEVEGLEGPAFINPVSRQVINDFGKYGEGQIGLSWYKSLLPRYYTIDAANQPIDEFFVTLKKGGKLWQAQTK